MSHIVDAGVDVDLLMDVDAQVVIASRAALTNIRAALTPRDHADGGNKEEDAGGAESVNTSRKATELSLLIIMDDLCPASAVVTKTSCQRRNQNQESSGDESDQEDLDDTTFAKSFDFFVRKFSNFLLKHFP